MMLNPRYLLLLLLGVTLAGTLLADSGPVWQQEELSIEELGRWGRFAGEHRWPVAPAAICGLQGGGFAAILIDGTLDRFSSGEAVYDNRRSSNIDLSGKPISLLQIQEDQFLVGTDRGRLFLVDLDSNTRIGEWPAPEGAWEPVALSVRSSSENILVVDRLHSRVWELNRDNGHPVHSWSGFIDPTAVTSAGEQVWVTDRGWHRLIPCVTGESTGRFSEAIGDHGAAPGLLAGPEGCAAVSERWIFVSDADNHRIQVIGRHGISLHHWGLHAMLPRESAGRLHYPEDLVFDPVQKMVVVMEGSESRVQYFGARHPESRPDPAELWERVDLISHYGVHWALDRSNPGFLLAVIEPDSERVILLDRRSDNPVEIDDVGGHGSRAALFRTPVGIDFMSSEGYQRFVVADRGNHRLQMFEVRRRPEARVIRESWIIALVRTVDLEELMKETPDWESEIPLKPGAVACLDSGVIAVADEANGRILLLDERFKPLGTLGEKTPLVGPLAIAADGDGILIADTGGGDILRWSLDGSRQTLVDGQSPWDPQPKNAVMPSGVARHPDGSILWTDAFGGRLFRTEMGGQTILLLGSQDSSEASSLRTESGELFRPGAVQVSADGSVWVVDHGNHRGVVIDPEGVIRHFGSGPYLPTKVAEETSGTRKNGES